MSQRAADGPATGQLSRGMHSAKKSNAGTVIGATVGIAGECPCIDPRNASTQRMQLHGHVRDVGLVGRFARGGVRVKRIIEDEEDVKEQVAIPLKWQSTHERGKLRAVSVSQKKIPHKSESSETSVIALRLMQAQVSKLNIELDDARPLVMQTGPACCFFLPGLGLR